MSVLDEMILAAAKEESATGDIAVFADPHLELSGYAVRELRENADLRLFVGARDVRQAFDTLQMADEAGVSERVFVAGYQSEIQLDIFFDDARSGFGGVMKPAQITTALTHLPKSLEELRYFAQCVAYRAPQPVSAADSSGAHAAAPSPVMVVGANNKHLERSHSALLGKYFADVRAGRGKGKFRCLTARLPREDVAPYAPSAHKVRFPAVERECTLFAVGGVFSGAKPDPGGKLLVDTALKDLRTGGFADASFTAVDLGCGNGLASLALTTAFPKAFVHAVDIAADAVCSTHLTCLSAILEKRFKVRWDDAGQSLPAGEADTVLLNPPFHRGRAVDPTLVNNLLAGAARLLKPGGILYFVHNSYLRYRPLTEKIGTVSELARNPKFTVLRVIRK